jgi:hypothetical protein
MHRCNISREQKKQKYFKHGLSESGKIREASKMKIRTCVLLLTFIIIIMATSGCKSGNGNSIESCEKETSPYLKGLCFMNLAETNKDLSLCEKAYIYSVECIKKVDVNKDHPIQMIEKICSTMPFGATLQGQCFRDMANYRHEIKFCQHAPWSQLTCALEIDSDLKTPLQDLLDVCNSNGMNSFEMGLCFKGLAMHRNMISLCEMAVNYRPDCAIELDKDKTISISSMDRVCAIMNESLFKDDCYSKIGVYRKNADLCAKAGMFRSQCMNSIK